MTPKHQTGLLFVSYVTDLNLILKLKIYTDFRDILSICQLHILLSRTAQISLELHFCVELHTKKPWPAFSRRYTTVNLMYGRFSWQINIFLLLRSSAPNFAFLEKKILDRKKIYRQLKIGEGAATPLPVLHHYNTSYPQLVSSVPNVDDCGARRSVSSRP